MSKLTQQISHLLRGKTYFGDFIKTLILGFMCYIIGFFIIILQIIVFASIGIDGQGVAIIYYVILMPIVLIPIMMIYFLMLVFIRFFVSKKN